ncbi:hypothetical protein KHA80_21125 [Anaerobacillus sp. HL2]|nr:hypothetical protein KHA80_21125 [Anaerobacillus sp. HL2]
MKSYHGKNKLITIAMDSSCVAREVKDLGYEDVQLRNGRDYRVDEKAICRTGYGL